MLGNKIVRKGFWVTQEPGEESVLMLFLNKCSPDYRYSLVHLPLWYGLYADSLCKKIPLVPLLFSWYIMSINRLKHILKGRKNFVHAFSRSAFKSYLSLTP